MKKNETWKPRNELEESILELLLEKFGEYTTVEKVCRYLNLHRNTVYSALDEGGLFSEAPYNETHPASLVQKIGKSSFLAGLILEWI